MADCLVRAGSMFRLNGKQRLCLFQECCFGLVRSVRRQFTFMYQSTGLDCKRHLSDSSSPLLTRPANCCRTRRDKSLDIYGLKRMGSNADQLSFYISLPTTPVYLNKWNGKTDPASTERQANALASFTTLYIIDPSQYRLDDSRDLCDSSKRNIVYVRSCLSTQRLYRELLEEDDLSSNFEFMLGARIARNGSTVERQLYALLADDAKETADDAMRLHTQQRECAVCVYERDTTTPECGLLWRLRDCQSKETNSERAQLIPEVLAASDETPEVSPIFSQSSFSPVYHDYERSLEVLDMYKDCAEVQQLLVTASRELADCKSLPELESMMKEPLVVVEGMDATGKTTLTEFLEEKLGAARYSTPPPCLLPLRRFFDKLPEIVRRAYYSLGNYIVAQQIATECQTRPVIMDRYWHSTAAYGIANECSLDDLPPPGHHDYCWPSDLLKPTAVIFLTVSEDVRRERLGNRHDSKITFEERSLNKDQLFRKRLCEAYLRMREPACIQVDASGSKEEVVDAVLKQLILQGILL